MSVQNSNGPNPYIDWQDSPDVNEGASAHDIMRVPATGVLDGICLSREALGVRVHYYKGKSLPHLKSNCPACADGPAHEWHGHIWFYVRHLNARYVLAFPAGPSDAFRRELANRGSLRGLPMRFTRRPQHLRGRVLVSFGSVIDPNFSMTETPSLSKYLENMWGRHMKICSAAEVDATAIQSEAERLRSANDAATSAGAPKRRRRAAISQGELASPVFNAALDRLLAAEEGAKINGTH